MRRAAALSIALVAVTGALVSPNVTAVTRSTAFLTKATGVQDPNSGDIDVNRPSSDGSRLIFRTSQRLTADDNDGGFVDVYEWSGGTTKLVSKPTGVADPNSADTIFGTMSRDGTRVFVRTKQKLTPDDIDSGREDVYERSGGTTKLITKPTGVADPDTGDASSSEASEDGSRYFFFTTQKMTPDDNDTARLDVYERSRGTTKLLTKPTTVPDPDTDGTFNFVISPNGDHFVFQTTEKLTASDGDTNRQDVYERINGVTRLISQPSGVTDPDTADATIVDISRDGSRIFFQTTQKMTGDDGDIARRDIYERSGGTTKLVSKATGVPDPDSGDTLAGGVGLGRLSGDGSRVFFETPEKLTADDGDTAKTDVYERSGGTTKLVSKPTSVADPDSGNATFLRASRDGSRVIFETDQKLTPDDGDTGREDVFERSAGTTKLLSKPTGVADPNTGDVGLGSSSLDATRIFLVTKQRMTADDGDTNRSDLYERVGGRTVLISKPVGVPDPGSGDVTAAGGSDDGNRVFFSTTQKLAPGDTDANGIDAYGALTPPSATTLAPSRVHATTARLRARVTPNTQATSFRFELGRTIAYGRLTPASAAGAGDAPRVLGRRVAGLRPNTRYHFRVRAGNGSGAALGLDRSFTTAPRKANLAAVKRVIRVTKRRRLRLAFRAARGLTGKARVGSLAHRSFRVPRSRKVRLRMRLTRKDFRALKRERRVKTRLTVTLRNGAGRTSRATKRVTLKAP